MNVLNKQYCTCTTTAISRIVGGRTSSVSYPWMVHLDLSGSMCGGFILNERQVVTAAHCTEGRVPSQVFVFAGINDLNKKSSQTAYRVQYIDEHRAYYVPGRQISQPGDFAVLTITGDKPFDFRNPNIKPACIDSKIRHNYGQLLATGWGIIDTPINYASGERANNPRLPQWLKEADFEYMEPARASETTQADQCRYNHLVCLRAIRNGDSVCSGDSGGPVHQTVNGMKAVIGVAGFVSVRRVSYNNRDATQACYGPSFYSRVSYYMDFLGQTSGTHNMCLFT